MRPAGSKLTIVVPVYRGAATITELVERLSEELRAHYELEIVLVDDASPDNSAEVMRGLSERYPWVVSVFLSRNFGEHNAVLAGLNHASGDFVVTMDDDLQNPPREVKRLVDELAQGHDVVYSRYDSKKHSFFRNFGSVVNDRVANVMLGKPPNLYLCSFRSMNRLVVDELIKFDGPFPYIDGLILRTTRRIGVLTVEHDERAVGQSGYTLLKLIRLWSNMFTSFSILPLRAASLFGLLVAMLGMLGAMVFTFERLRHPELPLGWASLMIALIVFSGVQLFALANLLAGDPNELDLPREQFDLAVDFHVLYHEWVREPGVVLRKIHASLRPNGRLVMTEPAHEFLRRGHDQAVMAARRWSRRDLRRLVEDAGFEIEHFRGFLTILLPAVLLSLLLDRLRPTHNEVGELERPSVLVDGLLRATMAVERFLMRLVSLPTGTSWALVARKR